MLRILRAICDTVPELYVAACAERRMPHCDQYCTLKKDERCEDQNILLHSSIVADDVAVLAQLLALTRPRLQGHIDRVGRAVGMCRECPCRPRHPPS